MTRTQLTARLDRLAKIIAALKAIYKGQTDRDIEMAEARLKLLLGT